MTKLAPVHVKPATRDRMGMRWSERLLLGAMLALALFSFEAGLAHVALARDDVCRGALASFRVAPAEGAGCMSEFALAATNALARGPAGTLLQEKMTFLSWALSGILYAILGGACAQLAPGRAVLAYLAIHALVLAVVSFIMFVGPHVIV
jgi:hypothetical protein